MTASKAQSISMRQLGYTAKSIRKLCEDAGEAVFIARVAGIVSEHFTGENNYGEWVGFRGRFMAVTRDGEKYESATAFLPAAVTNPLRENLEHGAVEIEVGADIYAQESDANASGYAYVCDPMISDKGKEKIQKLEAQMTEDLPEVAQIESQSKGGKSKKAAASGEQAETTPAE